jgi:hypothetical protein
MKGANAKGFLFIAAILVLAAVAPPRACGWDSLGHMAVAYVAYQQLTPQAQARANALIKLNPKYGEWSGWVPATATPADKDMMIFMLAATFADEIKGDSSYTSDGSANGNRPDGSPNPGANTGYPDKLMHKYWHFVDTPFTTDGTALPPIPTPNAQERITLFRGVLASASDDALKSYDLTWLLHLVGDVHQPLHCATRVSSTEPNGDNGGNLVKVSCTGCPNELHAFWDDLLGPGASAQTLIKPAIKAAKKVPAADPALAAKSDEKDWIAESFQAAQQTVYTTPVTAGNGPFALNSAYKKAAKKLAGKRIALAGARLANLINNELK